MADTNIEGNTDSLEELKALLKESLERAEKAQRQVKIFGTILTVSAVGIFVIMLTLGIIMIPQFSRINRITNELTSGLEMMNNVLEKTDGMMESVSISVENIQQLSTNLAASDLSGMISDVKVLVEDSEDAIQGVVKKLDSIELDTLNRAITDLSSIVSPMAKLFGRK